VTGVRVDVADGVAIITLARPEVRNAVNAAMAVAMSHALARVESDPQIRISVLTGEGGHFCSGMDLKAFLRKEVMRVEGGGFAGVTEARLTKPLIAAVEGYALAGGFEIAMACDLIVASEDAKFGLSEVKRGLVANAGGLVRLPRQIPIKIAAELIFTGDMYPASYLASHGLINRLVPAGQALETACELARKIAGNGPLAIAASKQVLYESQDWETAELFSRQREITDSVFTSADAGEGALAFAEKRAPVWRGR
jgi:enoyl-CoA hydratase